VGIAKEKAEEGEKLYRPGRKNPLILERHSEVLLFIMKLRDEAHRYGITFHRNWRQKEAMSSVLDTIAGVGPARKKALLTELGSLAKIRQASVAQLGEVEGINQKLAAKIHAFLQQEGEESKEQ
jgi:excinuclease ABC subunit C